MDGVPGDTSWPPSRVPGLTGWRATWMHGGQGRLPAASDNPDGSLWPLLRRRSGTG